MAINKRNGSQIKRVCSAARASRNRKNFYPNGLIISTILILKKNQR